MDRSQRDRLISAKQAAERHEWQNAFDKLVVLDNEGALDGSGLELLGMMSWWVGRPDLAARSRERAYAAYLAEGVADRAALMALLAAKDHQDLLADVVARAWRTRAEKVLAEEPEGFAHGYLAVFESLDASFAGIFERARERAARAVEIGAQANDADLQALGLVCEGTAAIRGGDPESGLRLIDEATAAAVGGELTPFMTGVVYCQTISTCRDLADYRRAGQWTEVAEAWCKRQSINGFPGVCRVHRAEIMALHGDWAQAEGEAQRASEELLSLKASAQAGEGYYTLGEIRLRMGDLDGADDAFRMAHDLGRDPQPGRSLHYLAIQRLEAASASIERALLAIPSDRLARARLLPASVEIALERGDLETARSAANELGEIADSFGSVALEAAAITAQSAVHLQAGDAERALHDLQRARSHWQSLDAPYELARARALQAKALKVRGEREEATRELESAITVFQEMGARLETSRYERLRTSWVGESSIPRSEQLTMMFTDIVGSTELISVIGDDAWGALKRWHDTTLRSFTKAHGGEEVNEAGDGFFFIFRDPGSAIDAARAVQQKLAEHRQDAGFAPRVRIGIHSATASRLGDAYVGQGVHEAARIGALAGAGEILVSQDTVIGDDSLAVGSPRVVRLKGIQNPVSVVSIDWRGTQKE